MNAAAFDVMSSSRSVEWPTPPEFFEELDREFRFTLDPCATPDNAKCPTYFTEEDVVNGLRAAQGTEVER